MKDILKDALIEGLTSQVETLNEKVALLTKQAEQDKVRIAELKAQLRKKETTEESVTRILGEVTNRLNTTRPQIQMKEGTK